MTKELIKLTLNNHDEPVLTVTHKEAAEGLEQKLLGMFIRQCLRAGGVQLRTSRVYKDSGENRVYDYLIGAVRADEQPDFYRETNPIHADTDD